MFQGVPAATAFESAGVILLRCLGHWFSIYQPGLTLSGRPVVTAAVMLGDDIESYRTPMSRSSAVGLAWQLQVPGAVHYRKVICRVGMP